MAKKLKVVKSETVAQGVPDVLATFIDVEKIKNYLFLGGTWNATLTTDNKIYIEVMKGQIISAESWETLKSMSQVPVEIKSKLDDYFTRDWSLYK